MFAGIAPACTPRRIACTSRRDHALSFAAAVLIVLCLATVRAAHAMDEPAQIIATSEHLHPAVEPVWSVVSFVDDAGLRGRYVLQVDFDDQGAAWFATTDGLRRFDGYRWQKFSEQHGLPSSFVRCVHIARDGTLWVGTDNGVARLDEHGQFQALPQLQLAGSNVRRIVEDDDGALWFCSDSWLHPGRPSGLTRLANGSTSIFRRQQGLPSDYVSDFIQDRSGQHFVLTNRGLARRSGDRWIDLPQLEGVPQATDYFYCLVDVTAATKVTLSDNGMLVIDDTRCTWRPRTDSPLWPSPKSIMTYEDQLIGITNGDRKTLVTWNGASFSPMGESIEEQGFIEYATVAPDGAIWCLGYSLLLRWHPADGEWREYRDLPTPRLVDSDGNVWFSDSHSAMRLDREGQWHTVVTPGVGFAEGAGHAVMSWSQATVVRQTPGPMISYGPSRTGLSAIDGHVRDAAGGSWFHGRDHDERPTIVRFDGTDWRTMELGRPDFARIMSAQADPNVGVWYLILLTRGAEAMLVRLGENEPMMRHAVPSIATNRLALHVDGAGRPWLFGDTGLFQRVGEGWQRVPQIPGRSVQVASRGADGSWFAYTGSAGGRPGVALWSGETWSFLEINVLRRVSFYGSGFALHCGKELVLSGPGNAGMRWLTIPARQEPYRVVPGLGEELWLSSRGGRVFQYRSDDVPPETFVTSAAPAVIEGDEYFTVEFHGVERFRPHDSTSLTYSWRFNEDPWTAFGPVPEQGLVPPRGPGEHRFEVRARDGGGDIDLTPAAVGFTVHPLPLQARGWFRPMVAGTAVLLAILLAGLVISYHRARRAREEARRLKLLEALRQSQKMEALGTLAAGVAHDFNNSLTAILGCTHALRQSVVETGPTGETVDLIEEVVDQASGVVQSLLTFSCRQPEQKTPSRLGPLVLESVRMIRPILPAAIELRIADMPNADLWVNADHTQIQQVLMNLAVNARDAMPQGGILRVSVRRATGYPADAQPHQSAPARGAAVIVVEDTGTGMSDEIRARIFEPFFTTKARGKGTGLGMSVALGLVADHGGCISVSSRTPTGTRIGVYLPLCAPVTSAETPRITPPPASLTERPLQPRS